MTMLYAPPPPFHRVAETDRPTIDILLDGAPLRAHAGDTLLVALVANGEPLRRAEFDPGWRAGFCLMGACQDCWVDLADGRRVRACTTPVEAGMHVVRP
jgi:predicted molibdopterin-dependent oxidoreductase YjgC